MKKSFATRMKERRARKAEAREAETRGVAIANGAADLAWQRSYQMTYTQFGAPSSEHRDGFDYFMEWADREGQPAVILNIGAVHSFMKRQTRRSVVQAIVSCASEFISAPRTKIGFVLTAPDGDFDNLFELEQWAAAEGHDPVRVIRDQGTETILVYVRSQGSTDWFGRSQSHSRPVMVFEVP